MAVLVALLFSKYIYLASIISYYIFFLMDRFALTTQTAQLCQFVFLAAVATGTVIGGPIGDRIGRKTVIWFSILGVLPFTLALPYVGLTATIGLSAVIGVILASAFPAIVVYGQELLPGRVGAVAGLFFGVSFGVGGIGAAALGALADRTGIEFVYRICAFLPADRPARGVSPGSPRTCAASGLAPGGGPQRRSPRLRVRPTISCNLSGKAGLAVDRDLR